MKFPDGFYKEGVLSITKLFKDKTGKAKNSDETFYAGIFDDEECTKLSENVAQNIIPLNLNGSSSVTAQIKVSIAQGTSKTFYVTEVDKDGKPIENMFVDRNGDGVINASDKYIYKKPAADVLMGLTSKFTYKNWDLSFALRASLNNYVYNDVLASNCLLYTSPSPRDTR